MLRMYEKILIVVTMLFVKSSRIQMLAIISITIMDIPLNAKGQDMQLSFASTNGISSWAKTNFLDYEQYSFQKDDSLLFVIVGTKTSGVATSEVFVYKKTLESYGLCLFLNSAPGVVVPTEEKTGINFIVKRKPKPILFLSWDANHY